MTERDADSAGGLTGATGDLTPDEIPDELIPAERREIEDASRQAAVTEAQASSGPPATDAPKGPDAPQSEARIGGDEVATEEEHL